MANSLSAEVWLDERRWDALEKALKARGTDIEQHLQDYLMKLYSETVPFDQWVQIERNFWMWPYGCAIMYEEALRQ